MNKKYRWVRHFVFGVIGVVATLFFVKAALTMMVAWPSPSQWMLFAVGAVLMAVGALVYFLAAYCYAFRMVEKVEGTLEFASIVLDGNTVLLNAPISYMRKIDFGSEMTGGSSQSVIFFLSGRRPWLCSAETFLPENRPKI